MNKVFIHIFLAVFYFSCSSAPFPGNGVWVDLTHSFSQETVVWPTSDPFTLDTVFVGHAEAGFYYEAYKFSSAEHGGTHLDAPVHFSEGKKSVHEIEIKSLAGNAVVIDVSDNVDNNRNYQIIPEDILAWENTYGMIPDHSILLFYTGFSKFWPDARKYLGTSEKGEAALQDLSFPGIHPDTALWLLENRNIRAIGLDTASLDFGKSTEYQTHRILFEENIPGFENVANLEKMPPTGAYVIALPMKIRNGSGAPLRIVAFLPSHD